MHVPILEFCSLRDSKPLQVVAVYGELIQLGDSTKISFPQLL